MRARLHLSSISRAFVALSAIACLDATSAQLDQPRSIASVTLQPSRAQVSVGKQFTFAVSAIDASGDVVTGEQVAWSSSDTAIASVSTSGDVTARQVGSATITASAGSHTGLATLDVIPVSVAAVAISPSSATIAIGDSLQLSAQPVDDQGNVLVGRAVSWSSSNTAIATVSTAGTVAGVAAGTAQITVTCEGVSATATVTVTLPVVATVTVSPSTASLLPQQSAQLTVTMRDSRGNLLTNRAVTWSTSDPTVASVSSSGMVVGKVLGAAVITATSEKKSGSAAVTVSSAPVASVLVTPSSLTLTPDSSGQLTTTLKDQSGAVLTGRVVSWKSSNTAIATVSSTGMVTGIAQGSATITATSEGKSGAASVSVVALPPAVASVAVSPATDTILVGATTQLIATPRDAGGGALTGRAVTWSSSNASVATVSSSGIVTGIAAGAASITATSEGKNGNASVHVTTPPVASVVITPSSASILVSGTARLTASTLDANGKPLTGRTVAWTTSSAAIATVSTSGLVTGAAAGSAKIVAASEGKADTASVTVTVAPVAVVIVSPSSVNLVLGATQQLTATTKDAAGKTLAGRTIAWSSSNSAVVAVSGTGLASAVATGSATIRATSEGKTGTATVAVAPAASHAGWYVAPTGTTAAAGTAAQPWDLGTALAGGHAKILPGDTVWLRAGTYHGTFSSTLTGTTNSPIIVRQYPGERATIDGNLAVTGAYTWYWGFEVTTSNPAPNNVEGVNLGGPGVKAIDMVVHDNGGDGFGVWSQAPNAEVYGSVVYNNGRQRVETGYAHGIYTQNDQGSKLIQDNIIFHQFAYGIHAYAQSGILHNITFDGNASFDNGVAVIDPSKAQPDLFFGGGTPVQNFTITNNMTWHQGYGGGSVWIGYASCGCTSTGIDLQNNYFAGGNPVLRFQNVASVTVSGNTLVGTEPSNLLLQQTGPVAGYTWSGNTLWGDATQKEFEWTSNGDYTFAAWKTATGLGGGDTFAGTRPSSVKVFVRPNKYEPGRANVIIYNWARQGSVSVDLSAVLQPGEHYEIRNVQNWFGTPVAAGTYNGGGIVFPMTAVTPPVPLGGWVSTPPTTGPDFNAFVVLPTP